MLLLNCGGIYTAQINKMETKKLYYDDAYLKNFDAAVISCELSDDKKNTWLIELDRTAFYPEGGGQPADSGFLYPEDDLCGVQPVHVMDVHERSGTVYHYCDRPLRTGARIRGSIDWDRRFDHMQQHSGEHIVSGMICEAFVCDNVGFHMGADVITIDYNAEITEKQLEIIEAAANKYIWENHGVSISWPDAKALETIAYRSKKELSGAVRIVSFPGADTCACCGTHVKTSAEVGLIKILSCQKFTKGSRIELLCGKRAFEYLSICRDQNRIIARAMAASYDKTAAVYMKKAEELSELRYRLSVTEQQLFEKIAEGYENERNVLFFADNLDTDALRRLCVLIAQKCSGRCAVFSENAAASDTAEHCHDNASGSPSSHKDIDSKKHDAVKSCGGYKYAIRLGESDSQDFIREMNDSLSGRGGGRGGFAQGSVTASRSEIEAFFAKHQHI